MQPIDHETTFPVSRCFPRICPTPRTTLPWENNSGPPVREQDRNRNSHNTRGTHSTDSSTGNPTTIRSRRKQLHLHDHGNATRPDVHGHSSHGHRHHVRLHH